MQVIIIDEERYFAETVQAFLEIEGFDVQHFSDATSAFHSLSNRTDTPEQFCMLVDVALAAGSNREIFSEAKTERYLTTGMVLIDQLFSEHPWWKSRSKSIVIYTAHYTTDLWRKMIDFATPRSIAVWQKRANASGAEIVELVRERFAARPAPTG